MMKFFVRRYRQLYINRYREIECLFVFSCDLCIFIEWNNYESWWKSGNGIFETRLIWCGNSLLLFLQYHVFKYMHYRYEILPFYVWFLLYCKGLSEHRNVNAWDTFSLWKKIRNVTLGYRHEMSDSTYNINDSRRAYYHFEKK